MKDKLVIDLGGATSQGSVYVEKSATVKLDDIHALVKGNSYRLDFFHCNRQNKYSGIITSISPSLPLSSSSSILLLLSYSITLLLAYILLTLTIL